MSNDTPADKIEAAYVIAWANRIGKGYGVAASLPTRDTAEKLKAILEETSDAHERRYDIHCVPTLASLFK